MKRLLCILSTMNAGGAETFLMKLYRQMDKTKYQMDFCINDPQECYYEKEIKQMGGCIYRIPHKTKSVKQFKKQLEQVIRDEEYQYVLRVTSNAMGFMDLMIAKQAGAKRCVARSSNSSDGGSLKSRVAHVLGHFLYSSYIDVKIAPSQLAATYTFGDHVAQTRQVAMLHNGLDLDIYHYDPQGRAVVRGEFGIPEHAPVFGHVGRFMTQKNHRFLLEIFSAIHHANPAAVLLLVGQGELEEDLRVQINQLDLRDYVVFAGVRSDIPQIMSAMDVFVFPSLYEGMPNAVIEAQAMGLPCVIADTITREADITGLVEYVSLSSSPQQWSEIALKQINIPRADTKQAFLDHKYDIGTVTREFEQLIFE